MVNKQIQPLKNIFFKIGLPLSLSEKFFVNEDCLFNDISDFCLQVIRTSSEFIYSTMLFNSDQTKTNLFLILETYYCYGKLNQIQIVEFKQVITNKILNNMLNTPPLIKKNYYILLDHLQLYLLRSFMTFNNSKRHFKSLREMRISHLVSLMRLI